MHRRFTSILLLAAALSLAGCGGDDDAAGTTSTTTEGVAETPPSTETPGAGTTAVIAVDYAFEGVPATVASGTRFTLTNESDVEVHELVAVRIPDDETRPVAELLALPEEELDAIIPPDQPPAMVIIAAPSAEGSAVVGDGSLTEPGRYALVCFVPTGADPDEFLDAAGGGPPNVGAGPPHAVQGMYAEVIVE